MGCEWIGWCALEQQSQAAWAQAILSFAAILIAIAVPVIAQLVRSRKERREAQARARSLAAGLISDVQHLYWRLKAQVDNPSLDDENIFIARSGLTATEIPARLESYSYRFHELGPASEPMQELYVQLVLLRNELLELEVHQLYNLPDAPDDNVLLRKVREAMNQASRVLASFGELFPQYSSTLDR